MIDTPVYSFAGVGSCLGHHFNDSTLFHTRVLNTRSGSFERKVLTVSEVLEVTDPHHYRLDYIYNNFEWSHCAPNEFALAPLLTHSTNHSTIPTDDCVYIENPTCSPHTSPVLRGIDVVAYRNSNAPVYGSSDFAVVVEGSYTFWFYSAQNRDAFLSNPRQFEPRLGGFSTRALINASIINSELSTLSSVDPNACFLTPDNDLYLFDSLDARDHFLDTYGDNGDYHDLNAASWHCGNSSRKRLVVFLKRSLILPVFFKA